MPIPEKTINNYVADKPGANGETLQANNRKRQRHIVRFHCRGSVKLVAGLRFTATLSKVKGSSPVHEPDLTDVSYSDFILYNYGQAYQRQFNPPGIVKLKPI